MFPYGVYCNILKHLPYEILYGSIRFVNHEFSLIASKILEQNERAWIVFFVDYKVYFFIKYIIYLNLLGW